MRIKVITIELKVPRWVKLLAPVALVFAIAGITALVKAEQVAPASFADGDTLTAANLNSLRDAIRALANPDCPIGYDKDTTVTAYTVCKKGVDEMVKVGTGAEFFWIDRYEASIWENPDGTGTQYGLAAQTEFPPSFPSNGQYTTPLFAVSKKGSGGRPVQPSAYISWFQAVALCQASGKHLPTREEWLGAARGTPDPGSHDQSGGFCNTQSNGARAAGAGTACVSSSGAEDMIGNLWEWTAEWYGGPTTNAYGVANWSMASAGGSYSDDATWNFPSGAFTVGGVWTVGLPAAAQRGGGWANGVQAGIYSFNLNLLATDWTNQVGVRCAISKHQ